MIPGITLADGRTAFAPGEYLTGSISWSSSERPGWLELRLFWYTEGKGTQDIGVAIRERFTDPGHHGEKPFRLKAPSHPLSCSGRLVSVRWALELVSSDDQPVVKVDVVIAPGGRETVLGHVE